MTIEIHLSDSCLLYYTDIISLVIIRFKLYIFHNLNETNCHIIIFKQYIKIHELLTTDISLHPFSNEVIAFIRF